MSSKTITPLSDKLYVEEHERYVEIYKIICFTTQKLYVGQAVSHILNRGKYRRYGMEKRLLGHVSEAFSTKKNQCHYLNNAIRKYGAEDFDVILLELCSVEDADTREAYYIQSLGTMFPNGYNLKLGTVTTRLSAEGRRRVSKGVHRYFVEQKLERFKDIKVDPNRPIEEFIRPLRRRGEQYGWYVYINGKKADFGGVHITLDDSYNMAQEFIQKLLQRDTLLRETP